MGIKFSTCTPRRPLFRELVNHILLLALQVFFSFAFTYSEVGSVVSGSALSSGAGLCAPGPAGPGAAPQAELSCSCVSVQPCRLAELYSL